MGSTMISGPDTGTQTSSIGDSGNWIITTRDVNDITTTDGYSYNRNYDFTAREESWFEPFPQPKQPCYYERGGDWYYYDVFLPIPQHDLNMREVSCGNHSPPGRIS